MESIPKYETFKYGLPAELVLRSSGEPEERSRSQSRTFVTYSGPRNISLRFQSQHGKAWSAFLTDLSDQHVSQLYGRRGMDFFLTKRLFHPLEIVSESLAVCSATALLLESENNEFVQHRTISV